MKELTLYKPQKSIFSAFHKKSINIFGSIHISNERKKLLKTFISYEKNKTTEKKLEEHFTNYIDTLNDFVMNKIYKRVKNQIASDCEKKLLSEYYAILQLKQSDFYEYNCRKQLFLFTKDYEIQNTTSKYSITLRALLEYETNEIFSSLFNYYTTSYINSEEYHEKYLNKIFSCLEEYSQKNNIIKEDAINKFSNCFSKEIIEILKEKISSKNNLKIVENVTDIKNNKSDVSSENSSENSNENSSECSSDDPTENSSKCSSDDSTENSSECSNENSIECSSDDSNEDSAISKDVCN